MTFRVCLNRVLEISIGKELQLIHIDLDTLSKMAEDSFMAIDPRDLAFLFASGKSEDFMRDQLGLLRYGSGYDKAK